MRNQYLLVMLLFSACAAEPEDTLDTDAGEPNQEPPNEADQPSEEEEVAALALVPPGCVSVNVQTDVGAKGDGLTNDTLAFQRAAARIQAAGCGELIIPPATYIVGDQIEKTNPNAPGPYYQHQPIFEVENLS